LVNDDLKIRTYECPGCVVCGSHGNELYADLIDQLFGTPGVWKMSRCSNLDCGLLWLDPMPLADDIGLAYKSYYTHQAIAKASSDGLIHLVIKKLRRAFAVVTGFHSAKQARDYRYLEHKPAGKLLDVGCGAGAYLGFMRDQGWNVVGIDFDEEAVKNAREQFGVNAHSLQLEEMNFPDAHFDAITMNHLIEHVPDPIKLLRECQRVLKPNGSIVVTTPNSDSLGHQMYSKHWRGLEPPRHLHIFSPASLHLLARNAGFSNIDVFTTGVNAGYLFKESMRIKRGVNSNKQGSAYSAPAHDRIEAALLQSYEVWKSKSRPTIGEEAVLICRCGE
jgi:2-polyprenyl-3-methyl-5-hydroxy-6-metoxy-1,4-benzoquinol methylase